MQLANFSALSESGRYYLEVPGVGRSWNFAIGADVYQRAYYLAMRSYYGQRCGTAVLSLIHILNTNQSSFRAQQ